MASYSCRVDLGPGTNATTTLEPGLRTQTELSLQLAPILPPVSGQLCGEESDPVVLDGVELIITSEFESEVVVVVDVFTRESETGTDETIKPVQQDAEQTAKRIMDLYNTNAPIFCKNSIKDVICQMNAALAELRNDPDSRPAVRIKDLAGGILRYEVLTGHPVHTWVGRMMRDADKYEYIFGDPCLIYNHLQELTGIGPQGALCPSAKTFCPMLMAYPVLKVNRKSKRVVEEYVGAIPCVEDRVDRIVEVKRQLEASSAWSQLTKSLDEALVGRALTVSNLVALACSSMTLHPRSNDASLDYSSPQHALLLSLRDYFASRGMGAPEGIRCYAQDPAYTVLDRRILQRVGFEVLDDPRAWTAVNDNSVVLSIAPDIPVRQIIADIARPIALVLDSPRIWDFPLPEHMMTNPGSPRVTRMFEDEYDVVGFPCEIVGLDRAEVHVRK